MNLPAREHALIDGTIHASWTAPLGTFCDAVLDAVTPPVRCTLEPGHDGLHRSTVSTSWTWADPDPGLTVTG